MNIRSKSILCAAVIMLSLGFTTGMTRQETKIAVETVVLSPGNTAPVAENLELVTYRNIAICGEFKATDPENEIIVFEIVKQPKYGEVKVNDDSSFTYDPGETKRSKDSFSYIAIDASGNRSEPATVSIKIEKQKTDVCYADIDGDTAEYSAVYLSENNIFTGECISGNYYFCPEDKVTQGEFLAMCLAASGHEFLEEVGRTGLDNDNQLPAWVKNCVSTAVLCGCYTGASEFRYNDEITYEEAVIMIDAVFDITDVVTASAITPYLRNSSAQAMNNLYSCGIIDEEAVSKYDDFLTKRDAALMLTEAKTVIENR